MTIPPYRFARSAAVFVETKRGLGADEEPYSCTVTIPDDGFAPVSAKNAALLSRAPQGVGVVSWDCVSSRMNCTRRFSARLPSLVFGTMGWAMP